MAQGGSGRKGRLAHRSFSSRRNGSTSTRTRGHLEPRKMSPVAGRPPPCQVVPGQGARVGRGRICLSSSCTSVVSLASSLAHVSLPSTNLMGRIRAGLFLLACAHLGMGSAPSHHPPGQSGMLPETLPSLHCHDARIGSLDLLATPRVSPCPLSFTHVPLMAT